MRARTITPVMNTAIAHRGMAAARTAGAGISTAPSDPFREALAAFAEIFAA